MKIGIVTIYNSQNCGSFLQALALTNFIKKLGYNVTIAKNKMYYKNKFSYRLLMTFKYIIRGQNKKAKNILKTCNGFYKARKQYFNISSIKNNDVCIYGSDTIWNVDGEYFGKEWKHYWGKIFNGKKIAYAPSIGPTSVENILRKAELCECIKDFSHIGVRDHNTHRTVSEIVGTEKDVDNVIDPTMLMKEEFYKNIASECDEKDFILFYYFGHIDDDYMEEIKRYADKHGKKLICFGDNIKGVDKQLCFNPLDMMAYYSKADLVITNTYHGNVFSIIFNKPFVNIDAGKAKVNDLLKNFELSERTINESVSFNDVAFKTIDYEKVNSILEEKRKSSGEYLKNAIEECERSLCNAC